LHITKQICPEDFLQFQPADDTAHTGSAGSSPESSPSQLHTDNSLPFSIHFSHESGHTDPLGVTSKPDHSGVGSHPGFLNL